MATDNIYSALIKVLSQNTVIYSQLGSFFGTSIPLIVPGTLSEKETALPALTLRCESIGKLNLVQGDENFVINCFADNEITSTKLARSILDELDDTNTTIDGFSMRFTASGLPSNGDPTAKEINTPVTMRVVYWR